MFFLLHDFIAVVGEEDCINPENERKRNFRNRRSSGERLGSLFTSQLPVVERKKTPNLRQPEKLYCRRLRNVFAAIFCVSHDTHFGSCQKAIPMWPIHMPCGGNKTKLTHSRPRPDENRPTNLKGRGSFTFS